MLEILKLFPPYLAILTILLVILPTFVCASMRISLYGHLKDLAIKTNRLINDESKGMQPKFLLQLEKRFRHASKQLEQVNSLALIDGIYSQEKFKSFRFQLRCENGEYITKNLPNLLVAFGLLGTFLGITSNLYNISQIISKTGSNITDLTNQLQTPLQSMGIAFITSLIALLCSSFLTVINLKFNTNLPKNKLLINLEDYLDNIYKPQVEGDTRLDKAVNRMVDQQEEFLLRFHENVGQVLERTFAKAANRIADDNEKAQKLATQVYEQLFNASSAINNGAMIFKESMVNLENQVNNLQTMLPIFKMNVDVFQTSSTKFMDSAIKIENSKFSENLENLTRDLAETETKFTEATKLLAKCTLTITKDNQKATELAQQIYQQFKLSSSSLEESSVIFADSALTIKESKFNEHLIDATANLAIIQEKFNQMANRLTQIVKPIEVNVKTLELSTDKMVNLSKNINSVNNHVEQINSRYVEMSKLSKEILVKEGEISIDVKNSSLEFIKSVTHLEPKLQQIISLLENNEREFLLLSQELTSKINQYYDQNISYNSSLNNQINTASMLKHTLNNK